MNYREKMREQINKYPYGEYYGLKPNQPKDIIRLLNEMDNADKYIKKIFFEKENLQSKIDKINQYIKEAKESDSCTKLPSGKISDVGYCIDALEDIENILESDVDYVCN